jgi:chemotaxis protein methyltransferase CheR
VTDRDYAVFRSSLRRQLVFSQHNLVCDSAFNEFQLIFCRNVLLYFDQVLRHRAHELFYSSLSNFGILVLGKKESLHFTEYDQLFQELREGLRVYRRVR